MRAAHGPLQSLSEPERTRIARRKLPVPAGQREGADPHTRRARQPLSQSLKAVVEGGFFRSGELSQCLGVVGAPDSGDEGDLLMLAQRVNGGAR